MKKRFRFGLVIGLVVALLAVVGFVGAHQLISAASSPPGSNCTGSDNAIVNVTISEGKISSSLASISPDICFRFLITNNDKEAHDFLIKQPGDSTVLAAVSNITPGQTETLDYTFADALTGTPIDLSYAPAGQQTPLTTYKIYLAR